MTEISSNSSNNDLTRHRPTGLTILALLFIIAGAFTLLAGITTLETALAQASGPISTDLEVLFIPLLSLLIFPMANPQLHATFPSFFHFEDGIYSFRCS